MIDMPPMWLVGFIVLIWVQVALWNPLGFGSAALEKLGLYIIVAGLVLIGVAGVMFWRHKTTIVPRRAPASMITSGLYRYSRNPIYLADAVILVGAAIGNGSTIGLLLVPVFMWVITRRFIVKEEAGLLREFPQEFAAYRARTRRWI